MTDSCVINHNGVEAKSDDFVAVLANEGGTASIFFHTDVLTLGMSIKMLCVEFVKFMAECSAEEQKEVTELLGSVFMENLPYSG